MILRELVLENFGSYRGRQSISLAPIELDQPENDKESPPIILFGGMNGGGK